MPPAPPREVVATPRPSWWSLRAVILGVVVLGAVLVGGVIALREPRFDGRTAGDWIDSLGTPEPAQMRGLFRAHQIRTSLEDSKAAFLPVVERELRRAARRLETVRSRHQLKMRLWGEAARLPIPALNPAPPVRDAGAENTASARLVWSTALLLDSSASLVAGLGRFEAVVADIPATAIEASMGFRAITDTDGSLTAALLGRLESKTADPTLRLVWVSCLGHLGSQASSAADLVRSLTRDADHAVRYEAIKALGTLDSRNDTAEFLRGCANDAEGRRAALLALAQMKERARPVEAFVRDALNDRDVLTSVFAKFALEAMEPAPTETAPSGRSPAVP